MAKRDPRLRAFVKLDKFGQVVPGTLSLRKKPPEGGRDLWIEIEANQCCSYPLNTFDYFLANGGTTGTFLITVNGSTVINATNTEGGTFRASSGDTVAATVSANPQNTLLVVDDTTGVLLSNQTGSTALTYSFTASGDVYSIIATSGPTTTTTTSTTTTSTTSTSTTTTSTTSTSTTSTTTTTTTLAAGVFSVSNGVAGMSISAPTPTSFYTGGTFPVAASSSTTGTLVTTNNVNISVPLTGTPTGGSAVARLYKNNVLVETIGIFTGPGTATFGLISFTTSDTIQITLRTS